MVFQHHLPLTKTFFTRLQLLYYCEGRRTSGGGIREKMGCNAWVTYSLVMCCTHWWLYINTVIIYTVAYQNSDLITSILSLDPRIPHSLSAAHESTLVPLPVRFEVPIFSIQPFPSLQTELSHVLNHKGHMQLKLRQRTFSYGYAFHDGEKLALIKKSPHIRGSFYFPYSLMIFQASSHLWSSFKHHWIKRQGVA